MSNDKEFKEKVFNLMDEYFGLSEVIINIKIKRNYVNKDKAYGIILRRKHTCLGKEKYSIDGITQRRLDREGIPYTKIKREGDGDD